MKEWNHSISELQREENKGGSCKTGCLQQSGHMLTLKVYYTQNHELTQVKETDQRYPDCTKYTVSAVIGDDFVWERRSILSLDNVKAIQNVSSRHFPRENSSR